MLVRLFSHTDTSSPDALCVWEVLSDYFMDNPELCRHPEQNQVRRCRLRKQGSIDCREPESGTMEGSPMP